MQANVAYNTVQLSNLARTSENVYDDIPEEDRKGMTTVNSIKTKIQRIQLRLCDVVSIAAFVLAALAVILCSVQLSNNAGLQQEISMCKSNARDFQKNTSRNIDALRLELTAVQENIIQNTNRITYSTIKTIIPTREAATTITSTTPHSETCGGPGWRRVAFINMTDPNQECPQELKMTNYSIRSCGQKESAGVSCSPKMTFSVNGFQYSQVCGRATAYRWGYNHGFYDYHANRGTLNSAYVDGLSLTHGSPPTHIWTFASGVFSSNTSVCLNTVTRCPCELGNTYSSPPFVGNDYFCESVATVDNWNINPLQFYPDNALWDGQDHLNPCYGLNNPPWFNKTLPVPTTDSIDIRLCLNYPGFSNIAIELLEIYVQ